MKNNYWQNRRRKEAQEGQAAKPVVLESVKRIVFTVNGTTYVYEYKSGPTYGFGYVYKGGQLIYSPYANECTDEGRRIESLLRNSGILG